MMARFLGSGGRQLDQRLQQHRPAGIRPAGQPVHLPSGQASGRPLGESVRAARRDRPCQAHEARAHAAATPLRPAPRDRESPRGASPVIAAWDDNRNGRVNCAEARGRPRRPAGGSPADLPLVCKRLRRRWLRRASAPASPPSRARPENAPPGSSPARRRSGGQKGTPPAQTRGLIRRAAAGGRRATSRLSFCARPKRLSSARTPPPSLWPSSDGAS